MLQALVTGVGGQDGILLARELRLHGRHVVGTVRPGGARSPRVRAYLSGVDVVELDVRSTEGFAQLLATQPFDEIYNLASMSSVGSSWRHPRLVAEVNGMAVLQMLETLRLHADSHGSAPRFYQASSSEMFGATTHQPQTEETAHHPRSPYGVAKSFAHHSTVNFRESYGLFACSGILYNHESPLRPPHFVTRKISRAAAELARGLRDRLTLGNWHVRRDWGSATDAVRSMRLTLEADAPADYVIGTGRSHSLMEFVEQAFSAAGLGDPRPYLDHDESLARPAEVYELTADSTKARSALGWAPSTSFEAIVSQMVRADLDRIDRGVEESEDLLLHRRTEETSPR